MSDDHAHPDCNAPGCSHERHPITDDVTGAMSSSLLTAVQDYVNKHPDYKDLSTSHRKTEVCFKTLDIVGRVLLSILHDMGHLAKDPSLIPINKILDDWAAHFSTTTADLCPGEFEVALMARIIKANRDPNCQVIRRKD